MVRCRILLATDPPRGCARERHSNGVVNLDVGAEECQILDNYAHVGKHSPESGDFFFTFGWGIKVKMCNSFVVAAESREEVAGSQAVTIGEFVQFCQDCNASVVKIHGTT